VFPPAVCSPTVVGLIRLESARLWGLRAALRLVLVWVVLGVFVFPNFPNNFFVDNGLGWFLRPRRSFFEGILGVVFPTVFLGEGTPPPP